MQAVLKPGLRLRNITIESMLGEGGMGSVWKGRIDLVDMRVAVKVMHPDLAASEQLRLRFLQEARAMASLRHDRIVPLNDFFHEETSGLLVLVMPLMEGRSLEDVFKDYPQGLPVDAALKYAGDALSALAFAHEHGVVHRDVKPSNILLTKEDKAYLMDFGIAKVLTEARVASTQAGSTIGTPDYMSPEQIRTPDQLDGRSDQYSMGCVLYEMLCGRPPFNPEAEGGERMVAVMTAHLQQAPPPLRNLNPSVSEALEGMVMKAMAKDRSYRFADCREFAQALSSLGSRATGSPVAGRKTVMEGPAIPAAPVKPPTVEPQPAIPQPGKQKPNQLVKIAGGVGVAAMLAIGAWMMSGSNAAKSGAPAQITVEPERPASPGPAASKGAGTDAKPQNEVPPPVVVSPGGPPAAGKTPETKQAPQVSPQEQRAQQLAQEAAALEEKGPGNYCNALIQMNEAARLNPDAYLAAAKHLKSLCDEYH